MGVQVWIPVQYLLKNDFGLFIPVHQCLKSCCSGLNTVQFNGTALNVGTGATRSNKYDVLCVFSWTIWSHYLRGQTHLNKNLSRGALNGLLSELIKRLDIMNQFLKGQAASLWEDQRLKWPETTCGETFTSIFMALEMFGYAAWQWDIAQTLV